LFSGTSFIEVVDGFPVEGLVIPCIAVEAKRIDTAKFEMGNRNRVQIRAWYIDVFAQNKSQRDEIGYTILNALEDCIPVYDYDAGFPPTVVTKLGCLNVEDLRMDIVRVMPNLVDKLYWRSSISFTAIYNVF
jgi:hypothetical protein